MRGDGGEDPGFAFGVVRWVGLRWGGEFYGDEGVGGLVVEQVGFVDCGEEAGGMVGAVWEGADCLGWLSFFFAGGW